MCFCMFVCFKGEPANMITHSELFYKHMIDQVSNNFDLWNYIYNEYFTF